jgi:hypothetical protein
MMQENRRLLSVTDGTRTAVLVGNLARRKNE